MVKPNRILSFCLPAILIAGTICSSIHVNRAVQWHDATSADMVQSWTQKHDLCPICAVIFKGEKPNFDLEQLILSPVEKAPLFTCKNAVNNIVTAKYGRAPPCFG
ncbi:MAG: hypothetical protein WD097_02265 [Balneolales bacterium]